MLEGALAEVVGACTSGGALTAWALYLELPPLLIGVLGALPFTAQLVQLPAGRVTGKDEIQVMNAAHPGDVRGKG